MREPLLLIHGFTDSYRTWGTLIPLLEPYHEVLAPSLVGHRFGPPLPADMTNPVDAMADGLERVLDEAGHERAHLVGNSLGGFLAFELAARSRALTVVALSPAFGWESKRAPAHTRRQFLRAHRAAPYAARHAELLARRPGLRRLALREVIAHPERVRPAMAYDLIQGSADCAIFDALNHHLEHSDYRGQWPDDLGVPTRIAWGSEDRTIPLRTCSGWFRQALPTAEWVDLPGLGHLPQHDDPQLVARTVLEVTARAAVAEVR